MPRASLPLPDVEVLRGLFDYDPETGILTRKKTKARGLSGPVTSKCKKGYLRTRVNFQVCLVHRVAWKMVHGEDPPDLIDHVNRVVSDNRIANLRPVNNEQNLEHYYNRGR